MRILATLCLTLLLSACGFHLRGTDPASALPFTTVRIDGEGLAARNLRDYLGTYKSVKLVKSGNAETVIRVLGEQYSKDVFSVNTSGRVSEYRLTYRLQFATDHKSKNVLERGEVELYRNLSWNDNAILSKEAEEATLVRDMQRDVVQLVLRRAGAVVKKAQSNAP
ncbi:LPS-assembly lipoprotein [Formivibrio citricus]|uniref:LPS-assembly lipoprotein LptE n=1 Tax=Formivibrio citricus TaxID=83765 RepID=A0A1I4Z1L4_9NEIS|nr:LPS assembly lipoprotein LptE [Formivibrio citricus]SFN44154.1 LPS-assembly lipoprotein [Formivibrio citricus]